MQLDNRKAGIICLCLTIPILGVSAAAWLGRTNSVAPSEVGSQSAKIQAPRVMQSAQAQPGPREPIGTARNGIFLAYPHDGSSISASSTYLSGMVQPGSTLTANGTPVKVNAAGFFAHVVPLSVGSNIIALVKNGDPAQVFNLTLNRPAPTPPVPSEPLQILRGSIQPSQDIGLEPGDIVEFGMRGSPGGQASVRVGNKTIPLQAAGAKAGAPNMGLNTAFGVTYQKSPATVKDLYTGFYKVSAVDNWQNETPEFTLIKDGTTVHQQSLNRVSVLLQPFLSSTAHDDTIVRVGPGAGRTTPLPAGVRVLIDGFVGESFRCEMASDKHFWIESKDLTGNEGPGSPPTGRVRTINIENEGIDGARLVIPLDQRLPFELKQEITPANRLQLRIYGATADTDWITEPSTSSHASDEAARQGRAYPKPTERARNPISFVTWQQIADRTYQATLNLNQHQQWGFWGEYEGTNLVLHVKGAPAVAQSGASLSGLKICVDPGHGGAETGTIGCSGIKESTINLAIGKRLARILRERGAEVVMTRDSDTDVSLNDRVQIAIKNNCDLLLSVHNNSLPDGRNPLVEHGTSSYYYHPQSLAFASAVRQGEVNHLHFVDFHTRWQNLALCRPSQMPAALAEVGFLNNPDEYATLLTDAGQEHAAAGLAAGVRGFLNQALAPASAKNAGTKNSGTKSATKSIGTKCAASTKSQGKH